MNSFLTVWAMNSMKYTALDRGGVTNKSKHKNLGQGGYCIWELVEVGGNTAKMCRVPFQIDLETPQKMFTQLGGGGANFGPTTSLMWPVLSTCKDSQQTHIELVSGSKVGLVLAGWELSHTARWEAVNLYLKLGYQW